VTCTLGCWTFSGVYWGRNVWELRSHTFLHYIKTRLPSHRRASDTQIRTASQTSAVKKEDPVWKFLQANAHFIQTIWCRNGVPTLLF